MFDVAYSQEVLRFVFDHLHVIRLYILSRVRLSERFV